jgi:hypothetical protein
MELKTVLPRGTSLAQSISRTGGAGCIYIERWVFFEILPALNSVAKLSFPTLIITYLGSPARWFIALAGLLPGITEHAKARGNY